jgi:hypothetical protein
VNSELTAVPNDLVSDSPPDRLSGATAPPTKDVPHIGQKLASGGRSVPH